MFLTENSINNGIFDHYTEKSLFGTFLGTSFIWPKKHFKMLSYLASKYGGKDIYEIYNDFSLISKIKKEIEKMII